jgi:hypothetical protein
MSAPADLVPGDTWSSLIDCVQAGVVHMSNHEKRGALVVTEYAYPYPLMTDRSKGSQCGTETRVAAGPYETRGAAGPYGCTRPYGHDGRHEAGVGTEMVASWPRS